MADGRPVSWRVNGERLVLLGWTRAILLQLAHPLVAAGVYEHSGFRASPAAAIGRLHHTTRAMLAITFGDEERRRKAIAGIRAIHDRVNGTLPVAAGPFAAGTRYSAHDPALLLWVHLTLIESMVLAYEQFVGPLSDADRDGYCRESAPSAIELGAHPPEVPLHWQGVLSTMDAVRARGEIVVTPQALELSRALLRGSIPLLLAPAGTLNRLLTVGMLPSELRIGYQLSWSERRDRAFDKARTVIRTTRRFTPAVLACWKQSRP